MTRLVSSTTKSASLPAASVPSSCSRPTRRALPRVYASIARGMDMRSWGSQPPDGWLVCGTSRVTAQLSTCIALSGTHGESVPNAMVTPARA